MNDDYENYDNKDRLDTFFCEVCNADTVHEIMVHYRICWYCDKITSHDGMGIEELE